MLAVICFSTEQVAQDPDWPSAKMDNEVVDKSKATKTELANISE